MNKRYLIIVLIIASIAFLTYYLLGGLKKPDFSIEKDTEAYIYGTYYEGTLGSDSLRDLFLTARMLVTDYQSAEAIAIAYYGDVNQENGFVRNFIGVKVTDTTNQFDKPEWVYRNFSANSSIKACIEANVLAMPTPDDLLTELRAFGQEHSIKADSIFIEYYAGPNNLCVELLSK